jgi:hypothetical protein
MGTEAKGAVADEEGGAATDAATEGGAVGEGEGKGEGEGATVEGEEVPTSGDQATGGEAVDRAGLGRIIALC